MAADGKPNVDNDSYNWIEIDWNTVIPFKGSEQLQKAEGENDQRKSTGIPTLLMK